jgi:hypothetical protein
VAEKLHAGVDKVPGCSYVVTVIKENLRTTLISRIAFELGAGEQYAQSCFIDFDLYWGREHVGVTKNY